MKSRSFTKLTVHNQPVQSPVLSLLLILLIVDICFVISNLGAKFAKFLSPSNLVNKEKTPTDATNNNKMVLRMCYYLLFAAPVFVAMFSGTGYAMAGDLRDSQPSRKTSETEETIRMEAIQLYRGEEYVAAAKMFSKAVTMNPENAENHAYLANAIYKAGNIPLAIKGFTKAIELDPTNARFLSNLGAVLVTEGRYDDAVEVFEKSMKLNPEDGTLKKNRDTAKMFRRRQIMEHQLMSEDPTEVVDVFIGKNYTNEFEITMRLLLEENPVLIERAMEVLRNATTISPQFAIARHVLSNVIYDLVIVHKEGSQDLLNEAKEMLTASLEIKPDDMCVTDNCRKRQVFFEDTRVRGSAATPTTTTSGRNSEYDKIVNAPFRVVCVSTAMRAELRTLKKSAEALGYQFDVLGMNTKWYGLGSKVTMFTDYLRDVDDDEVVLFVDAFDVLLLPDAKEIAKRYAENFMGRIVIGAELACSPDKSLDLVYPGVDFDKPFQYVNSGSYIGLVKVSRFA